MAHQDQRRNGSVCSHAYDLHKALRWLMVGVSMSGIAFRPECTWTPQTLVFASLLWAWSDEKNLEGTIYDRTQDYHSSLRRSTRTGRKLSGIHQNPLQMDRTPAANAFHGLSPKDGRCAGFRLDGRRLVGLCRRWQPRRCTAHPQERGAIFPEVEVVAQGPKTPSGGPTPPVGAESPRAQGECAADLADDDVACGVGPAVELADRPFRQQRTRTFSVDA